MQQPQDTTSHTAHFDAEHAALTERLIDLRNRIIYLTLTLSDPWQARAYASEAERMIERAQKEVTR